jgi:hypothetical protein
VFNGPGFVFFRQAQEDRQRAVTSDFRLPVLPIPVAGM